MSKEITLSEVSKHNKKNSVWMVIHNKVYDVTQFLDEHPGGEDTLLEAAGQDSTQAFDDVGHSQDAKELMKKYRIGVLAKSDQKTSGILKCYGSRRVCDKSYQYDGPGKISGGYGSDGTCGGRAGRGSQRQMKSSLSRHSKYSEYMDGHWDMNQDDEEECAEIGEKTWITYERGTILPRLPKTINQLIEEATKKDEDLQKIPKRVAVVHVPLDYGRLFTGVGVGLLVALLLCKFAGQK